MSYKYKYLNADMPDRAEVLRDTPNPAARQMLERLASEQVDTFLDRFEAQQPLCRFGLDGTCCRRCLWGPCRVTDEKKGICGADLALVVMANHLRMVAAGTASHGQRARQNIDALIAVAEGRAPGEIKGAEKALWAAERLGLDVQGCSVPEAAKRVAQALLADQSQPDGQLRALAAFAPKERIAKWQELGIMPTSPYREVFEALSRTTLGTDSDWRNVLKQELRLALAFFYSSVIGADLATEILHGSPKVRTTTIGYGTLSTPNTVKVAVHGHVPAMAEAIVAASTRPDIVAEAKAAGASGIELFGMCCTGQQMLARHGIPSTSGILGQEMVVGTGALDTVVADMACVLPAIVDVANCFGTEIITTNDSNQIPGTIHIPFDVTRAEEIAVEILRRSIATFARRDHSRAFVPPETRQAMAGFDTDSILESFGGRANMLKLLREGKIRGIATMVSCNTPKVVYEYNNVNLAKELAKRSILITTTGCASHALLCAGLADPAVGGETNRTGKEAGLPPVLPVGECVDNTRTMLLFMALAEEAGVPLHEMPYYYIGGEPGNEKALGMGVGFLVHGISVLTGYPIPVPVPAVQPNAVSSFFGAEALDVLGARMFVQSDPFKAAQAIDEDIARKRTALGWT